MRFLSSLIVLLIITIYSGVNGDIYMHSPPGSNNRNQEQGQNRDNNQRLFNSQNNDKGGYCRGEALEWYEKSYLPVEWTNQHGCGSGETECNIVIQYMCTDNAKSADTEYIRDGTVTTTISANDITQSSTKETNEYKFGMHESYYHYQNCTGRERNKGLFIANQNIGNNADRTRQSNNGNNYGYECQEERDYYPYWAPSPWKDVAVITDNRDLCKWYRSESQNVQPKYYCKVATTNNNQPRSIDPVICANQGGVWTKVDSHDIGAPECIKAEWTQVNTLGHVLEDGHNPMYNWSLPHSGMEPCIATGTCSCVLRVRYNISTSDLKGNGDEFTDYKSNGPKGATNVNDPNVVVAGQNVTLNINPNQYGRTFQDRSHVFSIIARPDSLKKAKIWNLLVKGKRGNIVQSHPAQEYQFVPKTLHIKVNEYIHYQWTGCDFNPQNYDGTGIKGSDRSNMCQIKTLNHNYPMTDDELNDDNALFADMETRLRFARLGQKSCLTYDELMTKNNNNKDAVEVDPQNCMVLNNAGTRFNGGVQKMTKTGSYYYMSTRNNNFSNRNQKGAIHIDPLLAGWQIGLIAAGCSLFVIISATAGCVTFARFHPHSGMHRAVSKVPGLKKLV
ncbi:hypothetical protein ACTFIW_007567 [Dictyostelium discoideum]